jgi:ABC-type multidrug transport system ATPase subunit
MTRASLAALSNVTKRFGAVVALDNLSLEIARGELLAVLGPNGAGKTTAIGLLLGLYTPTSGAARLFDCAPKALAARQRMGVMMQDVSLVPDLKVKEHLHLASSYYTAPMPVAEAMALTRVAAFANRTYGTLSGGQKKLVQFAVAVCGRPALLFLDEPTAGLDVESRTLVWETMRRLKSAGTAIVLTTHYLEEAEALADRVAVLVKGRLVADGTVDQIRAVVDRKRVICTTRLAPQDLERWPGVEAVVCRDRRVHLTVRNAEQTVRCLLTADQNVRDLEVLRAGLTEAFTELTQEAR